MAEFSQKTTAALKEIISPSANLGNPPGYLDLTAAHTERLHHDVLKIMFNDPGVDAVIQILAPSAFLDQKLLAKEVAAAWESQSGEKKPLLNVVTFGEFASNLRDGLEAASLPTVDYPDLVARQPVSPGVQHRYVVQMQVMQPCPKDPPVNSLSGRWMRAASACWNRKPMRSAHNMGLRFHPIRW